MIDFHDAGTPNFQCPKCDSEHLIKLGDLFQGIHWLAECRCKHCKAEFWHTYPIGHARHLPVGFSKDGQRRQLLPGSEWMTNPLIDSVLTHPPIEAQVTREVKKKHKRIVIINCLDDCYGHVLWKIFNTQHYWQYPEMGVVLLIPQGFEWLIPKGVAEVWTVQAPLKAMSQLIGPLDTCIKEWLADFKKVYISELPYTYHHTHLMDFEPFFKLKKLPLSRLSTHPLRVTFLLREDRFWLNNTAMNTAYLASRKFGMSKYLVNMFLKRQVSLVQRTAKLIKKQQPATFQVIGIGKSIILGEELIDLRQVSMDESKERDWLEAYQHSHLVIGIHGSHMMIPTAMAASFINLVPEFKTNQIGQDVLAVFPAETGKLLGHYLPEQSSPEQVAARVESICRRLFGLDKTFKEMYL